MAIDVTCASCKTRFQVSDKFAGKQGPCPKCKAIITVPAKKDEVVIHAPEVSGPKDSKGQLVLKPIARKETRLTTINIAAIAGSVVMLLVISLALRIAFREDLRPQAVASSPTAKGTPTQPKAAAGKTGTGKAATAVKGEPATETGIVVPTGLQVILALGAILLAPAIAFAGYTFLRNDELEPYRGQALYLRLAICAVAYPALWGIYWGVFAYLGINPPLVALAIIVPLMLAAGAFAAHTALDIEYGTALVHCGMYLSTTVLLRLIIGLPPHWTVWGT